MMIIGCDFHPSWQQVSWLDTDTGDCGERKLVHARGDAKRFYQQLAAPVLIGMEATGNSQWFIELVEDLGHEICQPIFSIFHSIFNGVGFGCLM
jgi:transposase